MSNKKLRSFMDIERMKELFGQRQDIVELVARIILENDELRVKSFEGTSIEDDSLSILLNACDDDFEYAIQLYKCDEEITPQKARFLLSQMVANNLDDDSTIQIRLICITDNDVY